MTANLWRDFIKGIKLDDAQRLLRSQYPGLPRCRYLVEVAQLADQIIHQAKREDLLAWFLEDAGAPPHIAARLTVNLQTLPPGPLDEVAPYTHHCVRTAFIFHLGLVNAVVGTKDTNRIDLEYLYYTPFCNCFSSGDKFLIALSAVTMSADQVFIPETQLKADFKELAKLWRNFTPEEFQAEEVRVGPPDNPASVTYQIWQKYMKLGYRQSKRPQRSPEMDRLLMEKLKRILDASSSGKPVDLAGQDGLSFSMRTRTMRLNGPCFCGGLKTFGECHGVGLKPS